MKKGNIKLFNNRQALNQLINLRINGFSLVSLAHKFGCDYTSVEAQCWKYNIEGPETVYSIETFLRILPPPPEDKWFVMEEGRRINRGKTYAEYLQQMK